MQIITHTHTHTNTLVGALAFLQYYQNKTVEERAEELCRRGAERAENRGDEREGMMR